MAKLHKVACACLLLMLVASASAAEKPDEYGDICWKREKELLRNFAIDLKNQPGSQGYLIHYAGRRTPGLGLALTRGRCAKAYLVGLGISPERILAVEGGFRVDFKWEVWVVRPGALPPSATPTVERVAVGIVSKWRKRPCP